MLPNHAPLAIAEQFAMLEALHPGRIDLGIGRAPGTDPMTASAFGRHPHDSVQQFPRDVIDVMGMLGDRRGEGGMWTRFHATPAADATPLVALLGSSGYSAQLAGMLGIPFAYAHHFDTGGTEVASQLYLDHFTPSPVLDRAVPDRRSGRARRRDRRARRLPRPAEQDPALRDPHQPPHAARAPRCRSRPSRRRGRPPDADRATDRFDRARGRGPAPPGPPHQGRRADGDRRHLRRRGPDREPGADQRRLGADQLQATGQR